MELIKCIEGRRSIRKYLQKEVSKETVLQLIEAANNAGSWKNSQVSRYYVALNETKNEFMDCLPEFNQNNIKDAPAVIVSTVVNGRSGFDRDGNYVTQIKDGFQYFDNGLQVQNLCLLAHDLGLGTLIMGIYDNEKIRSFFNIPENEVVVAVIGLGYPDIEPQKPPRKDIGDIVTFK